MKKNVVHVTRYAEHTDDPKSWRSPRPSFDMDAFNRKLEKRFGCVGSVPRFRLRWAGEHDEYVIEEWEELTGYVYRENGVERFVSANDLEFEFPDGAVPAPQFETHKAFTPRWVIEEYRSPFYHKLFFVELLERQGEQSGRVDVLSHYRLPSQRDIDLLKAYTHKLATLTKADIAAGVAKAMAQDRKEQAAVQEEIQAEMTEDAQRALIDGVPNATKFGYNPNAVKGFNINTYSRNLIKEHDKKL